MSASLKVHSTVLRSVRQANPQEDPLAPASVRVGGGGGETYREHLPGPVDQCGGDQRPNC